MARFTDRGSGVPIERPVGIAIVLGRCNSCHTAAEPRERLAIGLDVVTLCTDAAACCLRYRAGTSPESYAAGLRGEILGVAP